MSTPDVPIATWVGHPRSFTPGRRSGQPSVIVIHTTDGHEGPDDAENGAAYDKRRTDGTSTHYFVDSNSVIQEVEHHDEAHAARAKGNDLGIQIEICGLAGQSAAQWNDAVSRATLENVAQLCAQIRRTGDYPLRRLTLAQLRDAWDGGRTRGFCGHVDITHAFPEDHGTHTDPGPHFPWDRLFDRIAEIEEGDMAIDTDDVRKIWMTDGVIAAPDWAAKSGNQFWSAATYLQNQQAALAKVQLAIAGLPADVLDKLAEAGQSDEDVADSLRAVLGRV